MAYPTDGLLVYRVHGDTGDDLNGGGIFGAGTFISSPIIRTDIVLGTGGTLLTSAATPFTTAEVNHTINIISGTGFTVGSFLITAVDGSNVATVNASAGTAGSTGGTGRVGGRMKTLGLCAARLTAIAAQYTVVKCTGNFTLSNDVSNTANGPATFPQGTQVQGYHAVEDDNVLSSTMLPVVTKAAGSNSLNGSIFFTGGVSNLISSIRGFRFEIGTGSRVWTNANTPMISDCWFNGPFVESFGRFDNCVWASGSFSLSNAGGVVSNSTIVATTVDLTGLFANCLVVASTNSGVGDAFRTCNMENCTIVTPGIIFNSTAQRLHTFNKCLFYSTDSAGSVVGGVDYPQSIRMLDCAYNVAPVRVVNKNGILYSGDPFVNRAGGNYALTPAMVTSLGGLVPVPGVAATSQQFLFGSVIPQISGGSGVVNGVSRNMNHMASGIINFGPSGAVPDPTKVAWYIVTSGTSLVVKDRNNVTVTKTVAVNDRIEFGIASLLAGNTCVLDAYMRGETF